MNTNHESFVNEMTLEEKSNISHRKIATLKLVEMLNEHKV